jgi:hypothetical protein
MIDDDAPAPDLIAPFERAAEAARQTEQRYRAEAARRIAELAGERSTAFRRLNLVRSAVKAIVDAGEPETAVARARFIVAQSLGWDEIDPPRERVLDRLQPFLEALQNSLVEAASTELEVAEAALRDFEAWYRAATGSDFYALFERYMPETPRVDF